MESLAINDWVNRLVSIPEGEFTLRIDTFAAEFAISPDTLGPYAFYTNHYTRNLIYKCDLFEVLAICWDIGQISLPHDHAGQRCWMFMPIGRLRIHNFRVDERDAVEKRCRLSPTNSFDMDANHPVRVETDEPVHQVSNLTQFGERAISVHIYSRPYSSCEVYDTEKGVYSTKDLSFWSKYGQLVKCTQ